ncbi:MAG: hypothetical protein HY900_20775 [Deltaproteobacteria bacterium]|nr:hypothetical protein [Deltaproteobacteria bacterium]
MKPVAAPRKTVVVGMSTCNIAAGAQEVYDLCRDRTDRGPTAVDLSVTGCFGMCYCEPQVRVVDEDGTSRLYVNVRPARMAKIWEEDVAGGRPRLEWTADFAQGEVRDFFAKQKRIVLANCGRIDPESLEDYLRVDGYEALRQVVAGGTPEALIDAITRSGLRGRGGAGFPTGLKWKFAREAAGTKKYVICNADEGDPGAFMDRTTLESDPHAVLEGMALAAFATGADEGYVYCRAEYPLAVRRLRTALARAEEAGYLGERVLGADFRFRVHLKEGAGAFVCGEETALLASIEGHRGT